MDMMSTLKEKVMGWVSKKPKVSEPIQDAQEDALELVELKDSVKNLKRKLNDQERLSERYERRQDDERGKLRMRVRQLECEHGPYGYERVAIMKRYGSELHLEMESGVYTYKKTCGKCGKEWVIDANEYYEAVTAEKYAEYEKVWGEWAEACNADH